MSSMRPLSLIVILVIAYWPEKNTGNDVTRNTGNQVTGNDSHPRPCEQTYLCFNTTPIYDAPTLTCRCKHYAPCRITKREDGGVQSIKSLQSLAASDCYTLSGRYHVYNGTKNVTRTGLPCLRWADDSGTFPFFTGETKEEAENFCRIGGAKGDKVSVPWCYVRTKKKTWEYCEIESCDSFSGTDCFTIAGNEVKDTIVYSGTISTTISGKSCKRWDSTGRKKSFTTGESMTDAANYCRVVVGDSVLVPWCYTATHWEVCNVTLC